MILTNGLMAVQTSSNGENKSGCRLYLKVEKCGEQIPYIFYVFKANMSKV